MHSSSSYFFYISCYLFDKHKIAGGRFISFPTAVIFCYVVSTAPELVRISGMLILDETVNFYIFFL